MIDIDQRLAAALETANYRISLNQQRQNAKLKYDTQVVHAQNGGIFTVNRELISFVSTLISLEKTTAVLLDDNLTPILIDDINLFLEVIIDKYYEAANQYHLTYSALNRNRTVSTILGL